MQKTNTFTQWVLPSIVFLILLFSSLTSNYKSARTTSEENVFSDFEMQIKEVSDYYGSSISGIMTTVSHMAASCATKEDIWDDDNISLISGLMADESVKKVYIQKMNGKAHDEEGNVFAYYKSNGEYNKVLDGKKNVQGFFVDDDGDYVMLISAPIKSSSEMLGAVTAVYKPKALSSVVKGTSFLSTNEYYLITDRNLVAQSCILSRGKLSLKENLFEEIRNQEFSIGSYGELVTHFNKKKSGYTAYKMADGESKYLFYNPLSMGDAYLVMIVNADQVDKAITQAMRDTNSMVIQIIIYAILYMAFVVTINVINRTRYDKQSKDLIDKAETDLLTDLYNKISTEKKIKEYMEGEGRNQKAVMFMLDIDNFKRINDTMGHAFGDEVIAGLGKQLKAEFRVNDIVGRTGGDEFTIFLKGMKDEDNIHREAERLERFFQNFKVGEYTKYFATASIGAALYPKDGADFESLYKAADSALYTSKKRGKNQLSFYHEMGKN